MFEHDFLLGTYEDVPLSTSFWRHSIIQELCGKSSLDLWKGTSRQTRIRAMSMR